MAEFYKPQGLGSHKTTEPTRRKREEDQVPKKDEEDPNSV
jgi:hypothetical protein